VFDVNAKLGHWPYRPVKGLDELLRQMDRHGIERAAVSSLHAVFYFNPQDGNDELANAVAGHRDRLVPFAVLRPNFAGWQDDLARCADDYGMRGVVLYPNYHRYGLDEPSTGELAKLCAARRLPLCVQAGLEDPRRQFDREIVLEVSADAIGSLARAHPEVTVLALGLKIGQPERVGEPLPENFFFDLSNYEHMNEIEKAVERFGAEKMLFGTNFPLFNVQANVDKLRLAAIGDRDRECIARGNAERLLRL
jgi:predicted TIM-barrel fold metal-dependent hydrolase